MRIRPVSQDAAARPDAFAQVAVRDREAGGVFAPAIHAPSS